MANDTYNGLLRMTYHTPPAASNTIKITTIGTIMAAEVLLPGANGLPNERSQCPPAKSGKHSHTKSPPSSSRHIPPFSQGQIRGDGLGRSAAF